MAQRRLLRLVVAYAHVRDLLVRAKDLLEGAKVLFWRTNRVADRATICEAVPVDAWGLIALGSSDIGEEWIAETDVKSNGLNDATVKSISRQRLFSLSCGRA
jgi:hypothetical protein